MQRESLAGIGAVAAAAAVCALAPESSAATVHTQSQLAGVGEHTKFVTMVHQELHRPSTALAAWGSHTIPAGPTSRDVELVGEPDFDTYAVFGIADDGGIFVSFADPSVALGRSFDEVFPGFAEEALADALRFDPDGQLITDFMRALDTTDGVGTPMNVCGQTVHFSIGAPYGPFIASFTPIPTPGAALILAIGSGMASVRRRRVG
jgi:hypothetical protein